MKTLILALFYTPLLSFIPQPSGSTASQNIVHVMQCDTCATGVDSTLPEYMQDSLRKWVNEPIDSVMTIKNKQIDSLAEQYVELEAKVNQLHRESKKRLVCGERDTIRCVKMDSEGDPVTDSNGRILQKVEVKKWYYWKYPDGEKRYSHSKIKPLPDEAI